MEPLDQLGKAAFDLARLDKRVAELQQLNERYCRVNLDLTAENAGLHERVRELTAIARYLMAALHAAAADPHDDTWAIARDAAMKWPELAPGSGAPTTPPRSS